MQAHASLSKLLNNLTLSYSLCIGGHTHRACCCSVARHVRLFATPWTAARQASLSIVHSTFEAFEVVSLLKTAYIPFTFRASLVAQLVKYPPAIWEPWVRSLGWEDLLEEGMETIPVFLSGESHGQRSLAGYSPWGSKESDMTE